MPHLAPRTTAFACDLLHPPRPVDAARVQRVHDALFRGGAPPYASFQVAPQGVVLSNSAPAGATSQAAFLPDRLRFAEQRTGLTLDQFAARVLAVAGRALAEEPQPVLLAQVVTVRTLVTPRRSPSGRRFVERRLLGFEGGELEALGRPVSPLALALECPAHPGDASRYGVRVASVPEDAASVAIEVQGVFPPLPTGDGLDALGERIGAAYAFATVRVVEFLERFDAAGTP